MKLEDKRAHEALDTLLEEMRRTGKKGRIEFVVYRGEAREARIVEICESEVLKVGRLRKS